MLSAGGRLQRNFRSWRRLSEDRNVGLVTVSWVCRRGLRPDLRFVLLARESIAALNILRYLSFLRNASAESPLDLGSCVIVRRGGLILVSLGEKKEILQQLLFRESQSVTSMSFCLFWEFPRLKLNCTYKYKIYERMLCKNNSGEHPLCWFSDIIFACLLTLISESHITLSERSMLHFSNSQLELLSTEKSSIRWTLRLSHS